MEGLFPFGFCLSSFKNLTQSSSHLSCDFQTPENSSAEKRPPVTKATPTPRGSSSTAATKTAGMPHKHTHTLTHTDTHTEAYNMTSRTEVDIATAAGYHESLLLLQAIGSLSCCHMLLLIVFKSNPLKTPVWYFYQYITNTVSLSKGAVAYSESY